MVAEVSASPEPTTSAVAAPAATSTPEKPRDYNPRWKGYAYICFCSLVNFASVVNIPNEARHAEPAAWAASVTFGVVTFGLAGIILLTDRFQLCIENFHYTQAASGNFEGFTLLFFSVWWIVGYVVALYESLCVRGLTSKIVERCHRFVSYHRAVHFVRDDSSTTSYQNLSYSYVPVWVIKHAPAERPTFPTTFTFPVGPRWHRVFTLSTNGVPTRTI